MSLPHRQRGILLRGSQVDIDEQLVGVIYLLNEIPELTTTSSCQGNPGIIEAQGGFYGHVYFRYGKGWEGLARS